MVRRKPQPYADFAELGIQREVHGAISHPPDGNPLIGPAPGVRNYWCCCGTQIGIGWGPGLTRELARWMVHGAADISMRDYDPRRFGSYATKNWQITKAEEDYCLRHEIPFPHFNRLAGRPIKPSPLYDLLKSKGAVHEEVYGFERPRWFARDGVAQQDHYSFRRNEVHDMVGAEVKAVRDSVGIIDVTAFTKVEVSGPDAYALLDRLTANRMPQKNGSITLTHILNDRGRIELETTIVRMADDRFYLVCAAFFEQRLLDHFETHRTGSTATVTALSADWSALSLNGPNLAKCWRLAPMPICQTQASAGSLPKRLRLRVTLSGLSACPMRANLAGNSTCQTPPASMSTPPFGPLANPTISPITAPSHERHAHGKRLQRAGELTNEVTLAEADVLRFARTDKDYIGKG